MLQFELTEEEKVISRFKIFPIPTEEQIKEIAELQKTYTFYYKVKSESFNIFWVEGDVDFPNKLISAITDILVRSVEVSKDPDLPEQSTCGLKDKPTMKDTARYTSEFPLTPKQADKIEPILHHFFSDKFTYVIEDNVLKAGYKYTGYRALIDQLLKDIEDENILLFTVENITEADADEIIIRAVKDEKELGGFIICQSKYLKDNLHLLIRNKPRFLKALKTHVREIKRDSESFKRVLEKYEKEVSERLSRHFFGEFENRIDKYAQLFDKFCNEMREIRNLK